MKRTCAILIAGICCAIFSSTSRADVEGPGVSLDKNTPELVTRIADGLHVLDNGTPFTGYDVTTGNWQAGIITEVYKKYYVSIDLGGAAPLTDNTRFKFLAGARLHAGELAYDHLPPFQKLVDNYGIRDGLFKYTAGGAFIYRDWTAGHNSYGPYVGFEYHFN
jgi:hypothetical protein